MCKMCTDVPLANSSKHIEKSTRRMYYNHFTDNIYAEQRPTSPPPLPPLPARIDALFLH